LFALKISRNSSTPASVKCIRTILMVISLVLSP
jgi:hypothetical protein